jgi:signal transduction histidine kinase
MVIHASQPAPTINFSESELSHVAENYPHQPIDAGEILFDEGSPGTCAYIVLEGELEALKQVEDRQVLLGVVGKGELIGEMSLLQDRPRTASMRARTDAVVVPVDGRQFKEVLETCPVISHGVLEVVVARMRSNEIRMRQSNAMEHWNDLTAGMAHELNNPAAAIKRGVDQMGAALDRFASAQRELSRLQYTDEQTQIMQDLYARIQERAQHPPELDTLARSDREYEIETWLEDFGIDGAWEFSETLVNLTISDDELDTLAGLFAPDELQPGLVLIAAMYKAYSLLAEMSAGSAQISGIVDTLKGYSYLDQAPVQAVDVVDGLDKTLLILRARIGESLSVRREYAPDLPRIQAYGRELNQVWTNIINNAIQALDGQGEIVIRARRDDQPDWIVVEIEDSGPGIAPEHLDKLFDPFFTTKAPGKGTGLGLNISYNIIVERHRGEILVDSRPRRTCFTVRLPVDFERV